MKSAVQVIIGGSQRCSKFPCMKSDFGECPSWFFPIEKYELEHSISVKCSLGIQVEHAN